MQRRPSANSQMKPWNGCCPKHRANCTALSYWMPLTPHKWGLFYLDNCPWFSQAPGICTSMAAGSCMNNISEKWLGSYLSQWLNFTSQLSQRWFYLMPKLCRHPENVTRSPKEDNAVQRWNRTLWSQHRSEWAGRPAGHSTSSTSHGTLVRKPTQ